jgi:hypothetical protein
VYTAQNYNLAPEKEILKFSSQKKANPGLEVAKNAEALSSNHRIATHTHTTHKGKEKGPKILHRKKHGAGRRPGVATPASLKIKLNAKVLRKSKTYRGASVQDGTQCTPETKINLAFCKMVFKQFHLCPQNFMQLSKRLIPVLKSQH